MTIVFSNSSPKIPKQGIFDPEFKYFHTCTKLCIWTDLRARISNMTTVLSNSSPKLPKLLKSNTEGEEYFSIAGKSSIGLIASKSTCFQYAMGSREKSMK